MKFGVPNLASDPDRFPEVNYLDWDVYDLARPEVLNQWEPEGLEALWHPRVEEEAIHHVRRPVLQPSLDSQGTVIHVIPGGDVQAAAEKTGQGERSRWACLLYTSPSPRDS